MKFLMFYIISTAICLILSLLVAKSLKKRFLREYPLINEILKKEKISFIEQISKSLFLFVPIINILFALLFIFFQESIYKGLLKASKNKLTEIVGDVPEFNWTLKELENHLRDKYDGR